jgi:hypothetical protein
VALDSWLLVGRASLSEPAAERREGAPTPTREKGGARAPPAAGAGPEPEAAGAAPPCSNESSRAVSPASEALTRAIDESTAENFVSCAPNWTVKVVKAVIMLFIMSFCAAIRSFVAVSCAASESRETGAVGAVGASAMLSASLPSAEPEA